MISIPEPCNEDFSKMTPTQRGAFCSKCKIDTFDFRTLSALNINKVLLQNKGDHLCGQFTNKQIDVLNSGYQTWKNQRDRTFKSKFVLALVVVFGLALFSCNTQEEQAIIQMQTLEMTRSVDQIEYVNEIQNEGELNLVEFVEEVAEVICDVAAKIIMEVEEVTERGQIATAGVPIMEEPLGGAMVATNYWEYLEDTVGIVELEDPKLISDEVNIDFFKATAFPNPTQSEATLALDVKTTAQFDIALYDLSGRLIQTVYTGELIEGRQNFTLNLSVEETGMYLAKVVSNGQNETVKIQKVN